jgi:PleD family two-component response regulator
METTNSSDLYVQADKALYQAKADGKNRAVQYKNTMLHLYQQKH